MICSSSSYSSDCDTQHPIPEPIPAPLPPSGRPRRTARMSCKPEVSSSSDEDDGPAPQRKATRKRAALPPSSSRSTSSPSKTAQAVNVSTGVHLAPDRPRRSSRMSCKKAEVSSSSSDQDDTQHPIPEPIPAPLPPSGRPRRTASMSCKPEVSSSSSSSSDEDDSPAPQRKATRKRATLPAQASVNVSTGVHLAPRPHLQASNTQDAAKELKVLFDNANGHCSRVINSRELPKPYFILQCKECGARCTATKKVGWQVVSWDDKACGMSASVAAPAAATAVPKQMPETWECCMMHDATGPRVVCMNPRKPHNMCVECFENMVSGCMEGEERAQFLASGTKVLCFHCKNDGAHAFDMRVCASFLNEAVYKRYVTCLTDADVIKTQKEYEARLEHALASNGGGAASAMDTASEFTSFFVPSRLSCFISQANSSSILPLN